MYAIVETGGKQYRAEPGGILQIEHIGGEVGSTITLSQVRLIDEGDQDLKIGRPWLDGARVSAEILRQGRTRSIRVFKKKRRKNYRRTKGHRQQFTQIRVTDILMSPSREQ